MKPETNSKANDPVDGVLLSREELWSLTEREHYIKKVMPAGSLDTGSFLRKIKDSILHLLRKLLPWKRRRRFPVEDFIGDLYDKLDKGI